MYGSARAGRTSSPGCPPSLRGRSRRATALAMRPARPLESATTTTTGATLPSRGSSTTGTGQAGPYSVITSCVTAQEKYGYTPIANFMLARNGNVIAGDAAKVTFELADTYTDDKTGKPVANVLRYCSRDGDDRYLVTYTRQEDLARDRLIDGVRGVKRLAATLDRFDGAYLRFSGQCRVQYFRAGALAEQFADKAIWELMYFGHAR